jgi:L,D-peptidoglycan transpeptidase YkuD (ErfK/YbiS/YcfS/YnhG family)
MDLIITKEAKALWGAKEFPCAIGKNGFTHDKREGDQKTPYGRFVFRQVFYRADRDIIPQLKIPFQAISPQDGWCDDPEDLLYNQYVSKPYAGRHEDLWRKDEIYDVIVVLGYNDAPVVPYKGSAIFLHVARPDFSPTAGCVALQKTDLLQVLSESSIDTFIDIKD